MFKKVKKLTPQLLEEIEEIKEFWAVEAVYFAKNDFYVKCEAYSHNRPLTNHVKDILIEDAKSRSIAVNRTYFQREVLKLAQKYDEEIEIAEVLKEWDTLAADEIRYCLETIEDEF